MKTFDLFEIMLRDALISPCKRYSLLAYQDTGNSNPQSHYNKDTLDGLFIVKLWDNEARETIDTIVRENEEEKQFLSLNSEIVYLKDFRHPSGKVVTDRVAQAIHEFLCKTRGRRDLIEVILSRNSYYEFKNELMCRQSFVPNSAYGEIFQFMGCKIRVSEDLPYDFLVTEIWTNEPPYHNNDCRDDIWNMFPNIMGGCGLGG